MHQGVEKTYHKLRIVYYWPRLFEDVNEYVASCDTCQRTKVSRTKYGLLQPLEQPIGVWTDISVDLVTQRPLANNKYDAIMVVGCRQNKMTHCIPTTSIELQNKSQSYSPA